jgi:tetraacyldisaccharide 4'-kinase
LRYFWKTNLTFIWVVQNLRKLLFPFSVLYDAVTSLRNVFFDRGWLPQENYDVPIIAVGNLSTGGTGKTPMVEYLIERLLEKSTYKTQPIAVLSRGYGRSTNGFLKAAQNHRADDLGDEPLQYYRKYGESINVYVCEDRREGIRQISLDQMPSVIILDDAYQHRYVQADRYILLTTYDDPYYHDLLLPAGNLRESMRFRDRANDIVVTKCPLDLSQPQRMRMTQRLKPFKHQRVYFSGISYANEVVAKNGRKKLREISEKTVTVVTGIAHPAPMLDYLSGYFEVNHLKYEDHHRFRESEIQNIAQHPIVITTEKDYVRLPADRLPHLYYLPIKTTFLGKELTL